MKIVILDNKYCRLFPREDGSEKTIFNGLRSHLSYKMAGVEFTAAFNNGWNGITYLIGKKGNFMSGLLPKVKQYLTDKKINFTIEDKRKPIIYQPELDISKRLQKLNLVPREHQNRILNIALENQRGIVRACTGSGKSLAAAMIATKLNKPTIIYVIGLDLLGQFHKLFSSIFDEPIGYIGDGTYQIERINIATIWTIGRALKLNDKEILEDNDVEEIFDESNSQKIVSMLKNTNVHIFDESHIITTNTINSIYETIDPEYIYGFSGTPFRDDNTDLLINAILGEQIINVSASELIEKGLLAQPIIKFLPVPKKHNCGENYQSIYKNYIVENEVRNNLVVQSVENLLEKNYTPLVLFKQIKHGQILLDMLLDNGVKCVMLYGNDTLDRRMEVKEMLVNKEIDVILASTIYDLGVDIPELNGLVLAGGGKSSVRCLQRIGRVIRGYPGKKFAAVVDFYDQVKFLKKHSITRCNIYSSENGFKVIKCREMN